MCSSASHNTSACDEVRELIAWFPGRTLDENERRRVDEHVTECQACADLLRFVSGFSEIVREQYTPHPEAGSLVAFVEERTSLDSRERSEIEKHLAACAACREQVAMLEAVDRSIDEYDSREPAQTQPVPETPVTRRSRLRDFWDSLRGGILRPVPAAIYLILAVCTIGLLLLQSGGLKDRGIDRRTGEIDLHPGTGAGTLGGIVILPDETGHVRQPGREETGGVRIDAGRAQFLLLELTGLEAPPADDDRYTVHLVQRNSTEPVFESVVRGEVFIETYTLCLSLESGALAPGRYIVTVTGPGGTIVYRSSIDAR